jgi:outer membrane protein
MRYLLKIKSYYISSLLFVILFNANSDTIAQNYQNWTLQQCIDTALQNNLSVKQSLNATEINKINLSQSKSNLYPTLNGDIGQSYDLEKTTNSNVSLNSSVTLFNGFRYKYTIKQKRIDLEASQYDLAAKKNLVILNIIDAYLQILFAEELVKNAKSQYDVVQSQLENIEKFVNVGKKSESDLLQVKSQLASEKLNCINATGQLKSAKLNLQQIMNIQINKTFDVNYPSIIEPNSEGLADVYDIYNMALTNQPIVKSYELKTESAMLELKIIKGSVYPRLSLSGSLGTNYSNSRKITETTFLNEVQKIGYLQSNPSEIVLGNNSVPVYRNLDYPFNDQVKDNFSKSLMLSLSIPIYNNHQVRNNIMKQKINLQNVLIEEQNTRNDLRKTIEQSYINVENSIAKYNATREQELASKLSYENAKTKYENGMMSLSDFLQELNKYSKAQSENTQARYELVYNLKILDYYKGAPLTF